MARDTVTEWWTGITGRLQRGASAGPDEQRYRNWLIRSHQFLLIRGIYRRSPVTVELEDVYVPPTLWESSAERVPTVRLSLNEALRQSDRLVLLGGPGAGKTTLLSHLVLTFAKEQATESLGFDEQRLPIFVSLRDLQRSGRQLTLAQLPALSAPSALPDEALTDLYLEYLTKGQAILLLDGLDEIIDTRTRERVLEEISTLNVTYPGNRIIVTTEPDASTLPTGFTPLEISAFGDEAIVSFIHHWSPAVALAAREIDPAVPVPEAQQRGEAAAEILIATIQRDGRVRKLAANPLLLTMLATVQGYRNTLPATRLELYETYFEVLLSYWDEARGFSRQLDWRQKRQVLALLATWMQRHNRRDAPAAQADSIIATGLTTLGERGITGVNFLRGVRERSGLVSLRELADRGEFTTFTHESFQDYLTAWYLANQGEAGQEVIHHAAGWQYSPRWRGVIRFYAEMGHIVELVESLLARQDDIFEHNLLQAADWLVDIRSEGVTSSLPPGVETRILTRLLKTYMAGAYAGLRAQARAALLALASHPDTSVRATLVHLLNDPTPAVRAGAADLLGLLRLPETNVVEGLVGSLYDEAASVRANAATALGVLGQTGPEVVEGLAGLWDDTSAEVREKAIRALGTLGTSEPDIVERLLHALRDAVPKVRERAADALAAWSQFEPSISWRLVARLDDLDPRVRGAAAYALGWSEAATQAILESLVGVLNDRDMQVRRYAVAALGQLGTSNPEVVKHVVRLLDDPDAEIRKEVTQTLETLGRVADGEDAASTAEPLAARLGVLADRLTGEDDDLCWSATYELGRLLRVESDRIVVSTLQEELQHVSPEVVERWIDLLEDGEAAVRAGAATAVGAARYTALEATERLIGLLRDEEVVVRRSAVIALQLLEHDEPRVIAGLMALLSDEDRTVRARTATALYALGQDNPDVVAALVALLGDEDAAVRTGAAMALCPPNKRCMRIRSQHIRSLQHLLTVTTELGNHGGEMTQVKDVAWALLAQYTSATGERI